MRAANTMLAALVEFGALAAFAAFGWSLASTVPAQAIAALGLAGAVILAWGHWAAPKSPRRLPLPALLAFKLAAFALAVLALLWLGYPALAGAFAAAALLQLGLAAFLKAL